MFTMFGIIVFGLPIASLAVGWFLGLARIWIALVTFVGVIILAEACAVLSVRNVDNPTGIAYLALALILPMLGLLIAAAFSFAFSQPISPAPVDVAFKVSRAARASYEGLSESQKETLNKHFLAAGKNLADAASRSLQRRKQFFWADLLRRTSKAL